MEAFKELGEFASLSPKSALLVLEAVHRYLEDQTAQATGRPMHSTIPSFAGLLQ
jgi:hypothetical protein